MRINTLNPRTRAVISAAMLTGTSLIFLLLINPVNFILSLVHQVILNPILGMILNLGWYLNVKNFRSLGSMDGTSQLFYDLHDKPIFSAITFWHWISFAITFALQIVILYYLIKSFTCFHARIAGTKNKNFNIISSTCLTLYSFCWGYFIFVKLGGLWKRDFSWVFQEVDNDIMWLTLCGKIDSEFVFLNIDFQFIIAGLIALMVFVYKQRKLKNALIAQLDRATLF